MNWKAARSALLLSLLFLAVYGSCNYVTGLRQNVGSFYFEWERSIPFVPAMIIPYMSIDLFFICAPFLCRTDRERRILSSRITMAILVAGACFLLFPLRFAFERPDAPGWLGVIFDRFRSLDQPFNQFPSLHIALRTILAATYARHTRGLLRIGSSIWFSLIGFSTVLTYQHHVVDVAGGFALAGLCFYLFNQQPIRLPVVCNRRVGAYYGIGALLLIATAVAAHPWGLLLLWPATSLTIVAAGYSGIGPGIFRKQQGRLPTGAWFLLWPVLLGHKLSLLYYARQCRPWDELTQGVWIGRHLSSTEAEDAIKAGVTAVLDLTCESSEAPPFLGLAYCHLPILDLTAPTTAQLEAASDFLASHSKDGTVYVHCKIGYSRTAAVAAAYLLRTGQAQNVEDALATLRRIRTNIVIRPEVAPALRSYLATARLPREQAIASV